MANDTTQQMANAAKAFLLAAERCMEMRLVNGSQQMLAAPSVVNLALSVEIYMKCLLALNEIKIPKCHLLRDIFNKLPKNIKSEISSKMIKEISKLEQTISEMPDIFILWRYIYEQKTCSANIKFLTDLANAMQFIIDSTKPKIPSEKM